MRGNSEFRRRAQALQSVGLLPSAERVAHAWRAKALATGDVAGVVEANVRALSVALDRDEPDIAMQVGMDALPYTVGRTTVEPEVRARLLINMAKASWELGRESELQSYLEAAGDILQREPIGLVVRAHYAVIAGLAALDAGDPTASLAWTLQGLDLATAGGSAAVERGCLQNLIHTHILRGDTDRAASLVERILAANEPDFAVVGVLEDAVRLAMARGDTEAASTWARRLTAGYSTAPSQLSPLTLGFLFETLGLFYAQMGHPQAARWLWETGSGWFAVRGRFRDVERLRGLRQREWPEPSRLSAAVDEDLLYLGELLAAAHHRAVGQATRHLADTVHRLLPEVAPEAEPVATEHAALLYGLPVSARWFTGRTPTGQAAERVLTGGDEHGKSALDVLAAYERLATSGAPWLAVMRYMRRTGLSQRHVSALDRLYGCATA
ncbi:MAG TPA: hypothetical protein VNM16_00870 [Bacillota bacterium]|nr:hypothetical protein [Bacillota bacterium]